MGVLTRYLEKAMEAAEYDMKRGRVRGRVRALGVEAEGENLEAARRALKEALEDRVVEHLRMGLELPSFGGASLAPPAERMEQIRRLAEGILRLSQREAVRPAREDLAGLLAARGIEVQPAEAVDEDKEKILARLAFFMGERYPNVARLYERIKWSVANKRRFELSLKSAPEAEIRDSTQLATDLKKYALLTSYYYKSEERRIIGKARGQGWEAQFLTGGWFERYLEQKLAKVLRTRNLPFELLSRVEITLSGGQKAELDLLALVKGRLFWFEAKTGEFSEDVARYRELAGVLGVPLAHTFLVLLEAPDQRARELSALHGLKVVNRENFVEAFLTALKEA